MSWNPLLAYSMPLDVQVVNGLRIVAHPHINGDASEIFTKNVEEFCDYFEQHGGTATPSKLLRSSPLFRIPPKIEVVAGPDQPAVSKLHSALSNHSPQKTSFRRAYA